MLTVIVVDVSIQSGCQSISFLGFCLRPEAGLCLGLNMQVFILVRKVST